MVEEKLSNAGLALTAHYYDVPTDVNPNPGRGTILVGWISGLQSCDLYVEDVVRKRLPVAQQYIDRLS